MTIKTFIIGHPVNHSRSPLIHGYWLKKYGLEGTYERIDIPPEELNVFLKNFGQDGFTGGNVTLPHKEAAFRFAAESTEKAQRLQAANTLWIENGKLHADNTDGYGFLAHLDHSLGPNWAITARTILILGAGGAARAIVGALLDQGIETLFVANRNFVRADELKHFDPRRVQAIEWSDIPSLRIRIDGLVNTTSLGMKGQPALEIDLSFLPSYAFVSDIVYAPLETPLLKAARQRGLRAVDGLGMLLHQAVPGFERWFGIAPDVMPELRDRIVADLERI